MNSLVSHKVKNSGAGWLLLTLILLLIYFVLVNGVLFYEAEDGNATVVNLTLYLGANVNADDNGRTPLMFAVQNWNVDVVRTLIAHHADVNAKYEEDGTTALMTAASDGQMTMVKALINAGADVNAHDKLGRSALWWALQTDKEEFKPTGYDPKVVSLLRAVGAK